MMSTIRKIMSMSGPARLGSRAREFIGYLALEYHCRAGVANHDPRHPLTLRGYLKDTNKPP
jgi:hypothetical protein